LKTKLSNKGRIVFTQVLRKLLGCKAGEVFEITVEDQRVILTRTTAISPVFKIVTDPRTGMPVLASETSPSTMISAQVAELFQDFP
jgi:bifunctional DNA-binding transcriptional regulator/antitoxin component of YhaV-PrlF toxin-antitoxin module